MKDFYLFLPNRDAELQSAQINWVYKNVNNELMLAHGSINEASIAARGYYIKVIVAGENILSLQTSVPGTKLNKVQQAIPYVLEDEVIDDVDDLYFAINKVNETETNYNVSVINKDYFMSVLSELEGANIIADEMLADYALLDKNSVFIKQESMLFNTKLVSCGCKNPQSQTSTIAAIASQLKGLETNLTIINTHQDANKETLLSCLDSNIKFTDVVCEQHELLCLIENSINYNGVNLLQGDFKKKKDWSKSGKKWQSAAVLFLLWLGIQSVMFFYDYVGLKNKNTQLNKEITQIYKSTFPKSRRIIDAKAQMQQKLTLLKKKRGLGGRSFSDMLAASAETFSQTKGLSIKSLRYYDGRINIEINIPSLQALDKLKSQLQERNGYQVEIQNASSGKETVTASLQISGEAL